jgi:hypothetical protein
MLKEKEEDYKPLATKIAEYEQAIRKTDHEIEKIKGQLEQENREYYDKSTSLQYKRSSSEVVESFWKKRSVDKEIRELEARRKESEPARQEKENTIKSLNGLKGDSMGKKKDLEKAAQPQRKDIRILKFLSERELSPEKAEMKIEEIVKYMNNCQKNWPHLSDDQKDILWKVESMLQKEPVEIAAHNRQSLYDAVLIGRTAPEEKEIKEKLQYLEKDYQRLKEYDKNREQKVREREIDR